MVRIGAVVHDELMCSCFNMTKGGYMVVPCQWDGVHLLTANQNCRPSSVDQTFFKPIWNNFVMTIVGSFMAEQFDRCSYLCNSQAVSCAAGSFRRPAYLSLSVVPNFTTRGLGWPLQLNSTLLVIYLQP